MIEAAILLIALGAGFIFWSLKGEKKKPVIEVSLEDLSGLWLRYNSEILPVEESVSMADGLYLDKTPAYDEKDGETEKRREERPSQEKPQQSAFSAPVPATSKPLISPAQNGVLVTFVERLKPYEKLFIAQNAQDLYRAVVSELDRFGHCSSVASGQNDAESVDLYGVKDSLATVSLKEHSVGVANRILSLLERTYHDYENHIPMAVTAALAHDIGKIPEYWASGAYNTHEHPLISVAKLRELAGNVQIPWLEEVIKAVKDHHLNTNGQFPALLREADRGAREMELLKFSGDLKVMPIEKWLNPAKLMKLIEPHINVLGRNNKWQAVSFGGLIYCLPELIYEQARVLCRQEKILDLSMIYESEKGAALRRISQLLREAGYIPDILPQNYYARKVEITAAAGKKKFLVMPLNGEHFDLQALEGRKTGYLSSIKEVNCV